MGVNLGELARNIFYFELLVGLVASLPAIAAQNKRQDDEDDKKSDYYLKAMVSIRAGIIAALIGAGICAVIALIVGKLSVAGGIM